MNNKKNNIKKTKNWEDIKFNWVLLFWVSLLITYIITQKTWL